MLPLFGSLRSSSFQRLASRAEFTAIPMASGTEQKLPHVEMELKLHLLDVGDTLDRRYHYQNPRQFRESKNFS